MKTKPRLYSLFQRGFVDEPGGVKRWHRISLLALRKPDAVRVFQGRLLDSAFSAGIPERSLRVVEKDECENAQLYMEIQRRMDRTVSEKHLAYRKFTPGEEICR